MKRSFTIMLILLLAAAAVATFTLTRRPSTTNAPGSGSPVSEEQPPTAVALDLGEVLSQHGIALLVKDKTPIGMVVPGHIDFRVGETVGLVASRSPDARFYDMASRYQWSIDRGDTRVSFDAAFPGGYLLPGSAELVEMRVISPASDFTDGPLFEALGTQLRAVMGTDPREIDPRLENGTSEGDRILLFQRPDGSAVLRHTRWQAQAVVHLSISHRYVGR